MTPTPDHSNQWYKKTHLTPMGDTGDYNEHLLLCQGDRCIAERWLPDDEDEADFDRIIACANACAGMAYPEREIAKLREENSIMREALEAIEDRFCDGENTYDDWRFMGETAQKTLKKIISN